MRFFSDFYYTFFPSTRRLFLTKMQQQYDFLSEEYIQYKIRDPIVRCIGEFVLSIAYYIWIFYYNVLLLACPLAIINSEWLYTSTKIDLLTWFFIFVLIFPSWWRSSVRAFASKYHENVSFYIGYFLYAKTVSIFY
jgi:hypothetical protein